MTRTRQVSKNDKVAALLLSNLPDLPDAAGLSKQPVGETNVLGREIDKDYYTKESFGESGSNSKDDGRIQDDGKGYEEMQMQETDAVSKSTRSTRTTKDRYYGLQLKSDGSNQENVSLALKFLIKRIPELMDEPLPIPGQNSGRISMQEWVGSFSVLREGICFQRLAGELVATEPRFQGVTRRILYTFYMSLVKMSNDFTTRLEAIGGDDDGRKASGTFQRTYISDAAIRLAALDREYHRRRSLRKEGQGGSLKRSRTGMDQGGLDRRPPPPSPTHAQSPPSTVVEAPAASSISISSSSISPLSQQRQHREYQLPQLRSDNNGPHREEDTDLEIAEDLTGQPCHGFFKRATAIVDNISQPPQINTERQLSQQQQKSTLHQQGPINTTVQFDVHHSPTHTSGQEVPSTTLPSPTSECDNTTHIPRDDRGGIVAQDHDQIHPSIRLLDDTVRLLSRDLNLQMAQMAQSLQTQQQQMLQLKDAVESQMASQQAQLSAIQTTIDALAKRFLPDSSTTLASPAVTMTDSAPTIATSAGLSLSSSTPPIQSTKQPKARKQH
ncbi:hypothetical protein BGX29_007500 [Mortierella sp. GBA35]|nr:hypothetical protein BGX29_007500 [Mortierella sp. GBA35]